MPISRIAATTRTTRSTATQSVKLSQIKNSDAGLKLKSNAATLTLSGIAKGPQTVNPLTGSTRGSDYERTEERGANVSLAFDQDAMPKFDTSAGYTAKNKWYAAHSVEVAPKKGQTAKQVLDALASKINASSKYEASVTAGANGSATLSIAAR